MQLKQKLGDNLKNFLLEQQQKAIFLVKKETLNLPDFIIREQNKLMIKRIVPLNNGFMKLY